MNITAKKKHEEREMLGKHVVEVTTQISKSYKEVGTRSTLQYFIPTHTLAQILINHSLCILSV